MRYETPDDYRMPFGKHKGEEIGVVPASYLDWLAGQEWIQDWPEVHRYMLDNKEHILRELEESE